MKIRYVFKEMTSGAIEFRYATIQEIENGALSKFKESLPLFKLISRDRYIEMNDKNKREIYENDVDENGLIVSYIGNDSASCGMDLGWYLQRDNFEAYSIIEFKCNTCETDLLIRRTIYEEKN